MARCVHAHTCARREAWQFQPVQPQRRHSKVCGLQCLRNSGSGCGVAAAVPPELCHSPVVWQQVLLREKQAEISSGWGSNADPFPWR